MQNKKLSVIIPVYNEEAVLRISYNSFCDALHTLAMDYELIYIDDGSTDKTLQILRELSKQDSNIKVLSFSRNFGHQIAVTAGMDESTGDALVIIDADLQDPPELIKAMVELWQGGAKIVYGKRVKREGESAFKKATAFLYYRLLSSMSCYPIPLDSGDFRLLDKEVAEYFLSMREHNRFLRGMSAWMGYNAMPLEYQRVERKAGQSKYSLKKMLKLAFDGIAGFSSRPLTLPGWLGLIIMAIAFILFILNCFITSSLKGVFFGILFVVFIQGITLLFMGIQGGYMSRVLDEVKKRPLYIVKEKIENNKKAAKG